MRMLTLLQRSFQLAVSSAHAGLHQYEDLEINTCNWSWAHRLCYRCKLILAHYNCLFILLAVLVLLLLRCILLFSSIGFFNSTFFLSPVEVYGHFPRKNHFPRPWPKGASMASGKIQLSKLTLHNK